MFNPHQQLAILTWRLAAWSDAVAGTSYMNSTTGSYGALITDSNDATCGLTQDQMIAALLAIFARGVSNGESISFGQVLSAGNDVPVATSIKCLSNLTDDQLNKAILFLICKIVGSIAEN